MPLLNPLHRRTALFRAWIPVAGTLIAGCEATGPRGPASVSLSVASSAVTAIGTGTSSLRITNVEFVLAETAIAQAAARDPLQANPILIHLPLGTASTRKVINATVPAGRYTALATRLHAVGSGGGFGTLHPDWPAGVSVRVTGVYTDANGAHDFTFTSAADAQLQIAFARPITVDAARNVTLAVNVARWFRNGSGVLDPRNSANGAAINANISGSFAAFQDDDVDGVADEPAEIDDDSTEVEEDTTDVEDDTPDVAPSAIRSLLFRQGATSTR